MFALLALFVLLFSVPVLAATISDPGADPSGWFSNLYDAVTGSQWLHVAAVVLTLVVYVIRTYGPKKVAWLKTTRGGAVLVVGLAVGTGIINALIAGKDAWSLKTFLVGIQVAIESAIGWVALGKALIEGNKKDAPK